MSRSGETWYSQKTESTPNFVQKIIKQIKQCFTGDNEVCISTKFKDDYGSVPKTCITRT